jgi:acetyltransferase-like isoleucine patch superfamily enzyme
MLKKITYFIFGLVYPLHKKFAVFIKLKEQKKIYRNFKKTGNGMSIRLPCRIINPQFISIGENFHSLNDLRLEAICEYEGVQYFPQIIIGNNVNINASCHIACIDRVSIGNNVLIASNVYISDHSHGKTSKEDLEIPPLKRLLFTNGSVNIEDNVWIGEGVCVLPGVTIGKNSIIGANSVVSKDVPPYCIVAGSPAKILKDLRDQRID